MDQCLDKNKKDSRLYGKETVKALMNFALGASGTNMHLIEAMLDIKKAAAQTYKELKMMDSWKSDAIIAA